jgi:hypothetical protein
MSSFTGEVFSFTMASEIHSSPATSCWWQRGASISSKMLVTISRYGVCSMGRVVAKYLSGLNTLSGWRSSRAVAIWPGGSGASGGQGNISVAPAPSNNRLKLAARGRSVAESLRRTRAAA